MHFLLDKKSKERKIVEAEVDFSRICSCRLVAVGCWYFVVDISPELDLITTGQQSQAVRRRKWPHACDPAL